MYFQSGFPIYITGTCLSLKVKSISSITLGMQAVVLFMSMEFGNSSYDVTMTSLENQCT